MELPLLVLEVAALVGMSAICSGLNIALMSLNPHDLARKVKLGDPRAKRVIGLRRNSHLTLSAILLTNVAVISATSLIIDNQFNGLIAGVTSTLLIVVFGEVMPQALFARHALDICSKLSGILKLMIIVTYPISKPLQLLLDKLIGHEAAHLHTRHELGIIINEHANEKDSELDEDEVEIMQGALSLSHKRVRDIMTDISNTYWLTPDTIINASKIDEIKEQSWSRIPVFNSKKTECFGVLLMKDMVDVDFDDYPQRVSELRLHPTKMVGSMTALDTMFRKFISAKSHLIPVEKDDQIVGIVTIEDLIEEILGHEIRDESDHDRLAA